MLKSVIASLCLVVSTSACLSPGKGFLETQLGQLGRTLPAGLISLRVSEQGSSVVIFDDSTRNRTFSLTSGKSYILRVESQNYPSGSTLGLSAINTSFPNSVVQNLVLTNGINVFSPSVAGDYSIKVIVNDSTGAKLMTKDYSALITCPTPTFTSNSLHGNLITVSGSNNLYSYSAIDAVSHANGQAPYVCAWDLSGVGILDTGFTDCDQTLSNQYVTYVQNRKVGLVVKDACNTSYTVTENAVLAASIPTRPGSVYMAGTISNESGAAVTDSRIKGVHYLATNVPGHAIVSPTYNQTSFMIESFMTYGQSMSNSFGMSIEVTGLGGSFNLTSNLNGTIDTSLANVSRLIYVTDEADDQYPTVTLTSTTCTTTGIHAQVLSVIPSACTGTATGSNNQATVEVWGDYTCTQLSNSGSSATITGSFDGFTHLGDGCVGGGGPPPPPGPTGPGTGTGTGTGSGPGTGTGVVTPIRL